MAPRIASLCVAALLLLSLSGCATYLPPGARADLQAFAPADMQEALAARPTNPFPTSVAVVRVQAPGYTNYLLGRSGGSHGNGRYSVVLSREVGEERQLENVTGLPGLAGIVSLNRLLLPQRLEDDRPIRAAAARLNAGLVFVYTFDTQFIDEQKAKPLSVITLGLSPTRKITAVTAASALLMDTRTGYIYAAFETIERQTALSSSWSSENTADENRRATEGRAFEKLMGELRSAWPKIAQGQPARD